MLPQLSQPTCTASGPLIPLTMVLPEVPFKGWATRLQSSERKLENLILEEHTTEIGPAMSFHNYPQSLKKDSSRISVDEYLQGLEKYCELILNFNIFTQELSSPNCCLFPIKGVFLKEKP